MHCTFFNTNISRGDNLSLSCSFWSDPVSLIQWTWGGMMLENTSNLVIREFRGHSGVKTSILDLVNVGPDNRGVYTCTASNRGGQASDTR